MEEIRYLEKIRESIDRILGDPNINAEALRVFIFLVTRRNRDGQILTSPQRIVNRTGLYSTEVLLSLHLLREYKYVDVMYEKQENLTIKIM